MSTRSLGRTSALSAVAVFAVASWSGNATTAAAASSNVQRTLTAPNACPPRTEAVSYSDALDKLMVNGAEVGGLSDIAYDTRSRAWVSSVDNHGNDPSRLWFFANLDDPQVMRQPLVLTTPDGTPYTGTTADNEGLAVLPNGDYLVSSETEPSIRTYSRDGRQQTSLPIPARFAVTGTTAAGEATSNATLEGLSISPSGRTVVAAMEGALRGDVSSSGDATWHRLLVYSAGPHGSWRLSKQVAYRTASGQRIPEVALLNDDQLFVEEASYSSTTGNAITLYEVRGLRSAPDVSAVTDLSTQPPELALHKTLVADLQKCPTLGAQAKQTQTNPLLDNYEGMAITTPLRCGTVGVSLISDDNFGANQITRVLNLKVHV